MDERIFLRELANEIKIARKKAGKSQLQVYQDTGINVSRIEVGDKSIKVFTFYRLFKYFKINPGGIIKQMFNS
jgi:hypothetical protein